MTSRPTDPAPSVVRPDPSSLRALAHPLRLRLLGLLRTEGPATATRLAALTGQSSGSTSYHLRQLAAHGFVVEDAGRGNARDRWWRAAHRMTEFDLPRDASEEARQESLAVGEQYLRVVADSSHRLVEATISALPTLDEDLGDGWTAAFTMSDYGLRLTRDEAVTLGRELAAVVQRYRQDDPDRRDDAPEGSVHVTVQFQVLPHVPAPAPPDGGSAS